MASLWEPGRSSGEASKEGAVGTAEVGGGEEVGTVAEGFFEGSLAAPAANGGVVALGEDLGHGEAAEFGGAGVVGVVEEPAGAVGGPGRAGCGRIGMGGIGRGRSGQGRIGRAEALVFAGGFVAEDAGKETGDGIDDNGGGEFAAGEDVVADGELAVAEQVVDALVDALIAAADEDEAVKADELAGGGLGEGRTLGGEEDNLLAGGVAGGFGGDGEGFDGLGEGFGLENHALTAAKGAVVNGAVTVVREAAEVVDLDGDQAPGDGPAEDAVAEDGGEEVGENGDEVEAHGRAHGPGRGEAPGNADAGDSAEAASHCVMQLAHAEDTMRWLSAYAVAIIRRAGFC